MKIFSADRVLDTRNIMPIIKLMTVISNVASIYGGVSTLLKELSDCTAEELFKKSFDKAVKQCAPMLADITDPEEIGVDPNTLDNVIASINDSDITDLVLLDRHEKLENITFHFEKCIMLPGPRSQLSTADRVRRLKPVIEKTIENFFNSLPKNQEASNEMMIHFNRLQLEGQTHLSEQTQANHDILLGLDEKLTSVMSGHLNLIDSTAVETALAKEHQLTINKAKDLLKNYKPGTSLDLLEDLKQRIWNEEATSEILKFNVLTNMAAAQFALNNEQKAATLLLKAFQYNPEDEKALSNRAFAHLLLKETVDAANYAEQTKAKNPANIDAYVILVGISNEEETLEEVIDKVPIFLRNNPQIAYAISDIAKHRREFDEAKKWGEIMVMNEHELSLDFKTAFATILINQVLEDSLAVGTRQFSDSQKEQLMRAIELLTEAWDCVSETELRTFRINWILNRGTAYFHLGDIKKAIADFDTALEIEKSNSILLRKRAILSLEHGEKEKAIEFLEKIESENEVPDVPIIHARSLFMSERFDEAIETLNNFLITEPSAELREEANHLLIKAYIADKRFEEAQQISTTMRVSSPTNVQNLVDAARISSESGNRNEAISQLKEAYGNARDSKEFSEMVELATELYIHEQFEEAAELYEKLADTSHNSQLTQWLLKSYYNSGDIGKALNICKGLRERYGPIEHVSAIEFEIYEIIGDLKEALKICEVYVNTFPDDVVMQMHLAYVHYRLNNTEEFNCILEKSFDLKELTLQSCFNLAHLYQIGSKPEIALDIMYETRRMHHTDPNAHLKYFGLFHLVDRQLGELLNPTQVQPGTAVCLNNSGRIEWYIIEERDEQDCRPNELNIQHPLAQQLLGKVANDEIILQKNIIGEEKRKIVEIISKYVYVREESFRKFSELFPGVPGFWSMNLNDSLDESPDASDETTELANIQPILELTDKQHNDFLQIENIYKEQHPPIGLFMNWTGRNVLDQWGMLINKSDLGIRCCWGEPEERTQAFALLEDPTPKLVVDIISLITLHCLEAADSVVKVFGKLGIAQSTIDELQRIINEREGMWLQREGMSIEKQGDRYVRHMINPEDVRRGIEYLKDVIKWIRGNCAILPCTPTLQMNLLRKRKLDDLFQPFFIDTLLIASQPGHILLSDDERLRSYAKTNLNRHTGQNFEIEGVWTQVVLEHCMERNVLDRSEYDKMTIQLICSHYYFTEFDAKTLIEAAKQTDWCPSEPYISLVNVLGGQTVNLSSAVEVSADFLLELWEHPIHPIRCEHLTMCLLKRLTTQEETWSILKTLADKIDEKSPLYTSTKEQIRSAIRAYALTYRF